MAQVGYGDFPPASRGALIQPHRGASAPQTGTPLERASTCAYVSDVSVLRLTSCIAGDISIHGCMSRCRSRRLTPAAFHMLGCKRGHAGRMPVALRSVVRSGE